MKSKLKYYAHFNSIKVRLERKRCCHRHHGMVNFNSIKVRLERRYASTILPKLGYFNSIKVRLELEVGIFDEFLNRFQFHKGTIRTLGGATPRPL